jgi:hypothetical protein
LCDIPNELSALPLPVHLAMELVDELGDEVGRHQLVFDSVDDQALDEATTHTVAIVAVTMRRASLQAR